eukprot:m.233171 g.233171  ORF g.233171 m.233171 type:complete len:422 (-) comp26081_c0_seq1:238-1503(-)
MMARWAVLALVLTAPAATSAQCTPACDMTDSGQVAGGFTLAFKVQASVSGCADRICFEINVTDVGKYSGIGLSTSGSSMNSMEKLIVGRVGGTGYVYHAAPGGGYGNPSGSLVTDSCISSVAVTGSNTVRFARLLDGSQCTAASAALTGTATVRFATAVGNWGSSAATPSINKHTSTPGVQSTSLDSTSTVVTTTAGATNKDRAAHGTMMVSLWICLTTVSIFTVRYMRGILRAEGAFFKVHAGVQVLVAILTVVSIVLLSNKTESKLDESKWAGNKAHQRLGLSVMSLVLIQVVMGLMRNVISGKKQGSDDFGPNRWMFDWAHGIVGVVTWVLAAAAIYRGIELFKLFDDSVDETKLKTMVVVWAIVVVVIFFLLDIIKFVKGVTDKFETPSTPVWLAAGAVVALMSVIATSIIADGIKQ